MPSKMTFLFGVPMVVGCCAILWIYWDRFKKAPKKKIFISADCWLCVFDLLPPRQLGLGIAMISHRFDVYVDEHFKTRKWTLGIIRIRRKIEEHAAANEMEITNYDGEPLPIPKNPLPKKVVGFRAISIKHIDQNVIAFLQRFRQLFASFCPINLNIYTTNDRISEFILRNIWPMLGQNIHGIEMFASSFHHLRQIVPSILNECPSLRFVKFYANANLFTEFPADDSAAASDGQAMAKWLCTPLQNNVPKVLRCLLDRNDWNLTSRIEAFRAAFANASSPVNFIVAIWFHWSFAHVVVPPFDLMTNDLTGEQLAFKSTDHYRRFVLVRCPIARDESKWAKWEEEAIGWHICDPLNRIHIDIYGEDQIGDGLLDGIPGPNNQQK